MADSVVILAPNSVAVRRYLTARSESYEAGFEDDGYIRERWVCRHGDIAGRDFDELVLIEGFLPTLDGETMRVICRQVPHPTIVVIRVNGNYIAPRCVEVSTEVIRQLRVAFAESQETEIDPSREAEMETRNQQYERVLGALRQRRRHAIERYRYAMDMGDSVDEHRDSIRRADAEIETFMRGSERPPRRGHDGPPTRATRPVTVRQQERVERRRLQEQFDLVNEILAEALYDYRSPDHDHFLRLRERIVEQMRNERRPTNGQPDMVLIYPDESTRDEVVQAGRRPATARQPRHRDETENWFGSNPFEPDEN